MYQILALNCVFVLDGAQKKIFPLTSDPAWKFWVGKQQTNLFLMLT